MKRILGIDCSSTTIGYAILNWDQSTRITLEQIDYIKPLKEGHIIERIADTRSKIQSLIETTQPDYIGVEEIIQFMQDKSTAKTIIMLTTFNRMACLVAYDYLRRPPELFNVMSIRHGLKLNKVLPKKEEIPQLVAQHLEITFPYQLNKKGKVKPESYDMADGLAVALYYAFRLSRKIPTPKVKK
jgi:Holliday junction resolvasome RuvABC endonuclease subunit